MIVWIKEEMKKEMPVYFQKKFFSSYSEMDKNKFFFLYKSCIEIFFLSTIAILIDKYKYFMNEWISPLYVCVSVKFSFQFNFSFKQFYGLRKPF